MINMNPQERRVLLFLSFLLIVGFSLSVFRKSGGPNTCLLDFYSFRTSQSATVNINKATHQELTALPGIGAKTADAILGYRAHHGNFSSIEELKEVKGIGDSKLEELRKYLSVS